MSVEYALEKFSLAIRYAVGSPATLQERLEGVICEVQGLELNTFPNAEICADFEELIWKTTCMPARNEIEGKIHATTSQMSDDEAAAYLRRAFDIFAGLAEVSRKE